MAAPCEVFLFPWRGHEQTLLIVSNSGKMAAETYTLLKIIYGNEDLSHVCMSLIQLRESGRVMTSHLTELVAKGSN
jgi:hypothetical protein